MRLEKGDWNGAVSLNSRKKVGPVLVLCFFISFFLCFCLLIFVAFVGFFFCLVSSSVLTCIPTVHL